jgi:hypothetical protein
MVRELLQNYLEGKGLVALLPLISRTYYLTSIDRFYNICQGGHLDVVAGVLR